MIARSTGSRPFIGRQAELDALENARCALAQSSGSFLLIGGEAGIGKTRVVAEFLASIPKNRARNVLQTECSPHVQQPLGPIRSAARALIDRGAEKLPPHQARALVQIIPDDVPAALAAQYAGAPLEKEHLFSALFDFFANSCRTRATLLIIEDIHWADEATLEFLAYLAHRGAHLRLLAIATYREEELEPNAVLLNSLSPLLREHNVRLLHLNRLTKAETSALIDAALGEEGNLSDADRRDIEERAEGNPFFIEELLKSCLDGDAFGGQGRLPLSIRASILRRLHELNEREREIITHAAILGIRFNPEILAMLTGRDVDSLLPALQRAFELNLLVDERRGGNTCRFRHALTRQTIYDDIPRFSARRLHARILAALESSDDRDRHLEELAYHAAQSGEAAKSLEYNERAGLRAFELGALSTALTCFERADDSAHEPADRARILEHIGNVQQVYGRFREAVDAFESAADIHVTLGNYDDAARLWVSVIAERSNSGDAGALAYADRLLRAHGAQMSAAPRNRLLLVAARVACSLDDFESTDRFMQQVTGAESLAPRSRQNYLIVQLTRSAHFGDAPAWKRHALELETMMGTLEPFLAAGVQYTIAQTGIYLNVEEHVERAFEHAARIEREWEFDGLATFGCAVQSVYRYLRGNIRQALALVERVAAARDAVPARKVAAPVAALLAVALDSDLTFQCYDEEWLRAARAQLEDPASVLLLGAHAGWLITHGQERRALADLRLVAGALKSPSPEATFVMTNAARYLPLEEAGRVAELARSAAHTKRGDATASLIEAILAARATDSHRAVSAGQRAAAIFEQLGWPMLEAQSHEAAGRNAEARAIYQRCGAIGEVRRLSVDAGRRKAGSSLSARELEVATLVAQGLRNHEIAHRMNVGSKTVEKHLRSVFDKWAIRSRAQIAALLAEEFQA